MQIVNLEQRTDLWLEWRKMGVGASESSAVLGLSKYKSPFQLWEEKTHRAFSTVVTDDMNRGNMLEEDARHAFQPIMKKMYVPLCAEHDIYNEITASFDGISGDFKEFIEIKCPRTFKLAEALRTKDQEIIKKQFPENWVQIQHQYCVSNAERGYLVSYCDGEIDYCLIERDDEFIEDVLIPGVIEFMKFVRSDTEPPLTKMDYVYIDDADTIKLAEEWKDTNKQIKALQEQEKGLRRALIESSDDGNTIVGSTLRMTRISTQRTDYKKACEENNINLEPFKKTTIGYYRLTAL